MRTLPAVACGLLALARPAIAAPPVDFNKDVRPVLATQCYPCHGPDEKTRKADLRLDRRDDAVAAGAITPGKPADSTLLQRITSTDPDEVMPPPRSKKPPLTPEQVELLKRWVAEGAKYSDHWAFAKLTRPAVPAVKDAGWVRNPIDRFVLARLEADGLRASPEADRVTLLRRLSFDLTGLPPTPEEIRAFVEDRSPDAYEKQVDRLLASPHYGERMAVWWLDLVRYADSIGYHSDNPMNVSPYRDYVIRAFNENLPFDRFTVEQLAGDLLPNPTVSQKVASAYNRLLQTTEEGGAQPKEYEAKYAADRVRNFGQVWLGGTLMCAECHDHKFDPYTMTDFYSVAAFFADVQEAAVGRREPGMPVPDAKAEAELARLDAALKAARATLAAPSAELAAAQAAWETAVATPVEWVPLDPEKWSVAGESKLEKLDGGVLRTFYKVAANESYTVTVKADPAALAGVTGFRLDVLPDEKLPSNGPGNAPNGNFVLTEFAVKAGKDPVKLVRAAADHAQDGFPVAHAIDGKKETGWAVGGAGAKPHHAVFEADGPIPAGDGTLTFTLRFDSKFPQHSVGKFRLSATTAAGPARAALPEAVQKALAVPAGERTAADRDAVAAHYRTVAPLLQPVRDEITRLEAKRKELLDAAPHVLVTTAGPPRTVRVLKRGNWQDESGPVVAPNTPAFLPPLGKTDGRPTRLDLARWTVSADNPLTARVTANRLWKIAFGRGIARSLEESGTQGELPTHPELLDWLAAEFVSPANGRREPAGRDSDQPAHAGRSPGPWDIKHLLRLIVTSAAYRQSSAEPPALREKDPRNDRFARQARFRLDAEFVRDTALSVSGLLVPTVGGPSVKPYQPPGYWSALNFPTREWQKDAGDKVYRRGLYTHWQRTFPHPAMVAFDAPSREECTCDRPRSNVPQQALTLLNDPEFVEAAKAFAAKTLAEGGADDGARVGWAFRRATGRDPKPAEAEVLLHLLAKHRRGYAADPEAAKKLLAVGDLPPPKDADPAELAAWTSICRVVLNLHETITRP
jgi:hypothetical protein